MSGDPRILSTEDHDRELLALAGEADVVSETGDTPLERLSGHDAALRGAAIAYGKAHQQSELANARLSLWLVESRVECGKLNAALRRKNRALKSLRVMLRDVRLGRRP